MVVSKDSLLQNISFLCFNFNFLYFLQVIGKNGSVEEAVVKGNLMTRFDSASWVC